MRDGFGVLSPGVDRDGTEPFGREASGLTKRGCESGGAATVAFGCTGALVTA